MPADPQITSGVNTVAKTAFKQFAPYLIIILASLVLTGLFRRGLDRVKKNSESFHKNTQPILERLFLCFVGLGLILVYVKWWANR